MNEEIMVGLDFGTHQTKICIKKTPDEGHGIPEYEFFKFIDLNGKEQYFLPSVIQINKDDTLTYGYVDPRNEKEGLPYPTKEEVNPVDTSRIDDEASMLYQKYASENDDEEKGVVVFAELLKKKYETDKATYQERVANAESKYEEDLKAYRHERKLYRYFKQATFAEYPWESNANHNLLCVWYLAYVLFLLEEIYPDGFHVNMGVPTDDKTFQKKRELASRILISAFHLVEDVYKKDLRAFLKEKVGNLIKKTEIVDFSEEDKEFYYINIFPEAYASLIGLTSRGKLSEGMSLNADIGGGTTDISFFIVEDRKPHIYKYWSINRGLNFIAEWSGFGYSEKDFIKYAHEDIIKQFNLKKNEVVYNLIRNLISLLKASSIDKSNLLAALNDRILVYNGGGSTFPQLTTPIYYFNDVKVVDEELWEEELIKDKKKISKIFNLLTTSYGLAVSENDSDVVLCDFDKMFEPYKKDTSNEKGEIDKDVC